MDTLTIQGQDYQNGQVSFQYVPGLAKGTIPRNVWVVATETEITFEGSGSYKLKTVIRPSFDIDIVIPEQTTKQQTIEQRFRRLADRWRKETRHQSVVNKMIMHPAYQQIIGMGRDALPLLMEELKRTRGHWLWALFAITGEDPAPEGCTFSEAVDAWLSWGINRGYASSGGL